MEERKWEYIANRLRREKYPKYVVIAADTIDRCMVENKLDYPTPKWEEADPDNWAFSDLISNEDFCTACYEYNSTCLMCPLARRVHVEDQAGYLCGEEYGLVLEAVRERERDGYYAEEEANKQFKNCKIEGEIIR